MCKAWVFCGEIGLVVFVTKIDSDFGFLCRSYVECQVSGPFLSLVHSIAFLSVLLTPPKDAEGTNPVLCCVRKRKDFFENPNSASQAAVGNCDCCFFLCHLALLTRDWPQHLYNCLSSVCELLLNHPLSSVTAHVGSEYWGVLKNQWD